MRGDVFCDRQWLGASRSWPLALPSHSVGTHRKRRGRGQGPTVADRQWPGASRSRSSEPGSARSSGCRRRLGQSSSGSDTTSRKFFLAPNDFSVPLKDFVVRPNDFFVRLKDFFVPPNDFSVASNDFEPGRNGLRRLQGRFCRMGRILRTASGRAPRAPWMRLRGARRVQGARPLAARPLAARPWQPEFARAPHPEADRACQPYGWSVPGVGLARRVSRFRGARCPAPGSPGSPKEVDASLGSAGGRRTDAADRDGLAAFGCAVRGFVAG